MVSVNPPVRNIVTQEVVSHVDIAGPSSYNHATGIQTNMPGIRNVTAALAQPGSAAGGFASADPPKNGFGNQVTVHVYSSGSTELTDGTDLSAVTLHIQARGS